MNEKMMIMKKLMNFKTLGIIILFFAGTFMACNNLSETDQAMEDALGNGKATVVFKITDAPFPADLVKEANVTIDWIKLLKYEGDDMDEEGESENGEESENPSVILVELVEPVTYNLLELSNGLTATMAEMEVPAGTYHQIRLHIVDAGIILKDGAEYDLKVPGGSTSGLKVKLLPALELEENTNAEVLFDFDVSRSFVMQGNINHLGKGKINGFLFKPVVRAVAHVQTTTGIINGHVTDEEENPLEHVSLYLIAGEDTITSALTTETGFYAMIGIPAGGYTLSLNFNDDEYIENIDVAVEAGEETEQNFVIEGTGDENGDEDDSGDDDDDDDNDDDDDDEYDDDDDDDDDEQED